MPAGSVGVTTDGDSESTAAHRRSAQRLVLYWRTKVEGLAEEISLVEIQGERCEELRFYIKRFLKFISTTPIPHAFDENLQPKKDNAKRMNIWSTLSGYVGKHLLDIRRKFPNHEEMSVLPMDKCPDWYGIDRREFEKQFNDMKMKLSNDFVFGIEACKPMYRNNPYYFPDASNRDGGPIHNHLAQIDGNNVVKEMVRKAHPDADFLQQRCWLVLLDAAIGRAGELRLVKFTDWDFIGSLQVLKIVWRELKTRKEYALPIIHNREGWKFNCFHALGAFWTVEKGLYRTEREKEIGAFKVLFPSAYKVLQQSFSKKFNVALQNNLPVGTPQHIKKLFGGTSIKQGALTETYGHNNVSIPQACARSGHALGNSGDCYRDTNNPLNGIHAARSRSGYIDINGDDILPSVKCLGDHNQYMITKYIESLHIVSIPEFLVGGNLYPLLKTTTACLILYHPDVTLECGRNNAISKYMVDKATSIGLKDFQHPNLHPDQVLNLWSKLIKEDIDNRVLKGMQVTPDVGSMARGINNILDMVSKTSSDQQEMRLGAQNTTNMLLSQQSLIVNLTTEVGELRDCIRQKDVRIAYLEQQQRKNDLKLDMLKTPPPSNKKRRSDNIEFNIESVDSNNSTTDNNNIDEVSPASSKSTNDEPVTAVNTNNNNNYNNNNNNSNRIITSNNIRSLHDCIAHTSNLTRTPTKIDTVLINLAKAKRLNVDDFAFCCDSLTTHDAIASSKKRFKYCMELSNICTTLEERNELVEATTDAAFVKAAKIIAQKIGRKSWVVLCSKNASTRKLGSLSYDTVGKRIETAKKEIGDITGNKNYASIQVLKPWNEYRNSNENDSNSTNDNNNITIIINDDSINIRN